MSKKVSAREFLHGFAKLQGNLLPGESVIVTSHGKAVGRFVKESVPAKIPLPDFAKDAKASGYGAEIGDAVLKRLLHDEALS